MSASMRAAALRLRRRISSVYRFYAVRLVVAVWFLAALVMALVVSPVGMGLLVAAACGVLSVLARRVLRPAGGSVFKVTGGLERARAIVSDHAIDSLAPFILRADKSFEFVGGAVVAYRQVGGVAVVSGDPVGPEGSASPAMAHMLDSAHRRGCRVAVYGSSDRHLDAYRMLGLHALCVGEEAIVDPARFTLEGRPVRKLRQSVQRVARRGWTITALAGREVTAELEGEMAALESAWRTAQRDRIYGFAMSMGRFEQGICPGDLYLVARAPQGDVRAVMRFIAHCGRLSLDTMRRVGETPNGLNEALVCRALEIARSRGVDEVSLNYAGLGHLVRTGPSAGPVRRALTRLVLGWLGRRFQMERLVRFNEKFSPQWRPRYLVYESALALPVAALRVLQAEGYLPHRESRLRRVPVQSGAGVTERPVGTAQEALVHPDGRIDGNVWSNLEGASTPSGAFESYLVE